VLLLADQIDSFWVTSGLDYEGKPFKSVTQGLSDLALIPTLEGQEQAEASEDVKGFIGFVKTTLGEAVSDVRPSDRLTDSAVCLVAPEYGIDRQMERLLASAGRLDATSKPVLEINPRHALIVKLSGLGEADSSLREDAAHLLLDEARIADGEPPVDPRVFATRLARVIDRAAGQETAAAG
jgi:molecular chaperone HtpG